MTNLPLPQFPNDPSCKACEFHTNAKNVCVPTILSPDSIPSSPTAFVFIGQHPGYQEDAKNEPLVGKAGQYVRRVLCTPELGPTTPPLNQLASVYFTNAARCTSPPGTDPKAKQMNVCNPLYLYPDLDLIRASHSRTILFCLGRLPSAYVWKYLTGKKGKESVASYTKLNGSSFDRNTSFVATYHPAAMLKERSYHESIVNHLRIALDIILDRRPPLTKPTIVKAFAP